MYYLDVALPFIYVWKDCDDDLDQVECSHILCAPYNLVPLGRRQRKSGDKRFFSTCFKSENFNDIVTKAALEAL